MKKKNKVAKLEQESMKAYGAKSSCIAWLAKGDILQIAIFVVPHLRIIY